MPPRRALLPWLVVCYAFLYLPIAFLIGFSFNESRSVTAWSGFSWRWYGVLFHDQAMIGAALLSLRIAAASASIALVVGTASGLALARFGRFRGRAPFEAALFAPLILPEVITGLSLLLLFVLLERATGWPSGRGAGTVTIAHASVSVAYVAVVVRARLADVGTALEDAAADLYAPPWRVFALITVPLMLPALISGWLLAFTLSLDDVVVASFTSGPGATTLPMLVFSATRLGVTPEIYALATVIVVLVGGGLVLAGRGRKLVMRVVLLVLIAGQARAATLTVGPDQPLTTPSAAAREAKDGDTVLIEPCTYYDCAVWKQNRLVIAGTAPGVVITDLTCQGKALFVVAGDGVTIRDLTLARARVPDKNGAGVRLEGQDFTLERVRFSNDQVGLLSGDAGKSTIRVVDCVFEAGGRGGERPLFAVSVGLAGLLRVEGSTFSGVEGGQIATSADRTELIRDKIETGAGDEPAVAVLATGGVLAVEDSLLSLGLGAPRLAAAVLAMGVGRVELRRDRMENRSGRNASMLLDWTGTEPLLEGNQVAAGDAVLSTNGRWRHRASGAYHATKDAVRGFLGGIKRGLLALVGR
jgi:putrescine transport system permease protein